MQKTLVLFLGREDFWARIGYPSPGFLPGKLQGQRSLAAAVHRVERVQPDWSKGLTAQHSQDFQELGHHPLFGLLWSASRILSHSSEGVNSTQYITACDEAQGPLEGDSSAILDPVGLTHSCPMAVTYL